MQEILAEIIPRQFRSRPRVATRFLYFGRKPGRVTCLYRQHGGGMDSQPDVARYAPGPPHPAAESKMIEDGRVYAISYIVTGRTHVRYADEAEPHPLRPGDFFQFNGHHVGEVQLARGHFAEFSLCFDRVTGERLLELEIWDDTIRVARAGLQRFVAQGYLKLFNAILDHTQSARGLLCQCGEFVDRLYALAKPVPESDDFRLRACSLISANLGPRFTMTAAAQHLGMSYDEFRRRFKQVTGVAPIEYQLRCRMEHACLMLRDHSVKETAALLDYDDVYAFSKQFKVRQGIAPRNYQRKVWRSGPHSGRAQTFKPSPPSS